MNDDASHEPEKGPAGKSSAGPEVAEHKARQPNGKVKATQTDASEPALHYLTTGVVYNRGLCFFGLYNSSKL